MAFDLVQYFVEQLETQKPELLKDFPKEQKRAYLHEINALTLGKLISQWHANPNEIYREICEPDALYIQEVARHLTTSKDNASSLDRSTLEQLTSSIFALQLTELKQLHDTGNHNQQSIRELLLGQLEHLSGQADDWVWSTNNLTELKGSKPEPQDNISLEASMKEFNQMVHQQNNHQDHVNTVAIEQPAVPTWSKVVEPVVAIVILWVLYTAASNIFA